MSLSKASVVAPAVGLSANTLLRLAREGAVPFVKINKRVIRFDTASVVEALRAVDAKRRFAPPASVEAR